MKVRKIITSAMITAGIISGLVSVTPLSVSAVNSKVMYYDVEAQLQKRITDETKIFPGGSYWNHKGKSSYNENTYSYKACDHLQDKANNSICCSEVQLSPGKAGSQCVGFAYKLAKDIWGTTEFYSNKINNSYEPKVGDNVRLYIPVEDKTRLKVAVDEQPHSIFITSVSGDKITFAECNGELENCQILWNRKEYYKNVIAESKNVTNSSGYTREATLYQGDENSLVVVDKSFLRKYGVEYQRPVIAGDLNKNGMLDSKDLMLFTDTVMKDGTTLHSIPLSYYDVNGDGHVDMNDYNSIRYGSNNLRIVLPNESTTSRWNTLNNDKGSFIWIDNYFVKNKLGGVAWIGSVDKEISSFEVPSKAYCSEENKWYDVTEIGYDSLRSGDKYMSGNGGRTCTAGYKINTLSIPDSVKRIHSYAFDKWTITSIKFSGSNPQLEEIGYNAFNECKSLKTLDLSAAKKLKSIANGTFEGCTSLYHIDLPNTGNSIKLGTEGGSIFGSTNPDGVTMDIANPNNSTSGSSYQSVYITTSDYNYWLNNDLYFYGRMFRLYHNSSYIGKVDRYNGYLRP